MTATAVTLRPAAPMDASTPPAKVPNKMARNVPASIKALPPTISLSCRCCGSSANFRGPNNVTCMPSTNRHNNNSGTLFSQKPIAATLMMPISASCPEKAENRKNGRINRPAAMLASTPLSAPLAASPATPKVTRITSALRNTLSLNAPANCVRKNGRKRRVVSSCH